MSERNNLYAEREIELATEYLIINPDNQPQKDRKAYWLAFVGRFEEADSITVSDKTKQLIDERRNNLPK